MRGEYKPNTFNDKVKHLKRHFRWLYEQRLVVETPRNLNNACAKIKAEKKGKPLSVDEVAAIWEVAKPRVRCWIALGLNCGFYSKDISDLVPSSVDAQPGYVCRRRAKSDVPSRHLLWKVTQQLIQMSRYTGRDACEHRLFMSANKTVMNEAGRDLIGRQFIATAKKAKVPATFAQVRDTGAEFIEQYARNLNTYDPALTQLYLTHSDNRTATYYLSNDPTTMKVPQLDKALRVMDRHFKLKL
jgi:hypothetical protein